MRGVTPPALLSQHCAFGLSLVLIDGNSTLPTTTMFKNGLIIESLQKKFLNSYMKQAHLQFTI